MFSTISKPRTVVVRLAALAAAGLLAFSAASTQAQTEPQAIVPNRITQPINPEARYTLQHNVHPLAQAKYDQGAAPGSMATGRIMLVLKRSEAQDNALKQFLGDLQNPNSSNYRKWLTPTQFGKAYGISDTDLTTVTAWLQSQGFTVEKVPQARNVIEFSGNVAQVQQAFNTSVHKYVVNGETHFANSTDPQIPAALAPVIGGVAQLNDFRPKRGAVVKTKAHYDSDTKNIQPDLTLSDTQGNNYLFVGPADAATIYDTPISTLNQNYKTVSSLLGSKSYDGSGVTIGLTGDSNITPSDITNYRAGFLPSSYSANVPNIIIDGNDPGINGNGDGLEALLDLEVSGGVAPGANINFYTAADTDLQTGLFLAIFRALDDNAVSILNVSFGLCEAFELTSGNQQILSAWEQAAAQGISVTVSTGDSGSAGCDNENAVTTASNGLAVSGLASTPYNIAVGGTDYNVLGSSTGFSQYVNTSNSASNFYETAKGYIPESPWNDSPATNTGAYSTNTPFKDSKGNTNIVGAGGGISSCTQSVQSGNNITCTAGGYAQPSFQSGVVPSSLVGSGASAVRAIPDVSLLAADESYGATWVVCADSVTFPASDGSAYTDCQPTGGQFTSSTSFTGVGGTSASAPAFAGMLALVAQSQGGARLGQADYVLYNLAGQASLYGTVFHDVTTGNNSVVCTSGTPNCGSNGFLSGYNTAAGYDAATGLGSVDVSQLVANWKNAKFTGSTTSLTINGLTGASVPHGTVLTFNVGVNPTAATGDVSILNTSGVSNNATPGFLTLSGGTASGTSNALPGGSYNVYANYAGDSTYAASKSNNVPVTITQENSTTSLNINIYDASTGNNYTGSASSIPYGLFNFAVAQPYGNASTTDSNGNIVPDGNPTGTVNFYDSNNSLASANIASNGAATYSNYQLASQSFSVGTHSFTAKYSGDPSFSPSTSTAQPFTIVQAGTTTTATSSAASVASASNVTISVAVAADSIGAPPSGTVQLYNGTTAIGSPVTLTQAYSSTTGLVQSTATFTLTGSSIISAVKVARAKHSSFPWELPGGATALACVLFFSIPAKRRSWKALLSLIVFALTLSTVMGCGGSSNSNNNNNGGNGGTASITAKYAGDTNYATSTSAAVTVTVTQ